MEARTKNNGGFCNFSLFSLLFFCSWYSSPGYGMLSPKAVNFEVEALMDIKNSLKDPHNILNWDTSSPAADPCTWTMVTCSPDGLVTGLGAPSQSLSGTLSPSIGNLTNLELVLLQNNNISGHIPAEIGNLTRLRILDLSNNSFNGGLPSSLSNIKSLQFLRLNNNSLTEAIPPPLANMTQLTYLDLSYNNLTAPVPTFHGRTFNIVGNPLICGTEQQQDCFGTVPTPQSPNFLNSSSQSSQPSGAHKEHKIAIAVGLTLGGFFLLAAAFALLVWLRRRNKSQKQQVFDVKSDMRSSILESSRDSCSKSFK